MLQQNWQQYGLALMRELLHLQLLLLLKLLELPLALFYQRFGFKMMMKVKFSKII
jgi:hypothetical protein